MLSSQQRHRVEIRLPKVARRPVEKFAFDRENSPNPRNVRQTENSKIVKRLVEGGSDTLGHKQVGNK